MGKSVQGRSRKRGLPPGTPVYIGVERNDPVRITVFSYDADNVVEKQVSAADCPALAGRLGVTWINIDGVYDAGVVQTICNGFGVHPLVQEDILNTEQRAKVEDYGDHLYIVLRMLQWNKKRYALDVEQLSLILLKNTVLSFQERPGDAFDPVRESIRAAKSRTRQAGADFLAYRLIDAIIDGYFSILEKRGEQIEAVEDEVIAQPDRGTLHDLYRLKREGLFIHKAIWPAREAVSSLARTESPLMGKDIQVYLRDVYDHAIQALDTFETHRDMLSGMLDTYLSSISNRMNEIMKVLTIIATIFIPLTFLVGVYGMNFKFMPELYVWWTYPLVWVVIIVTALGMLWFFKRKRWL